MKVEVYIPERQPGKVFHRYDMDEGRRTVARREIEHLLALDGLKPIGINWTTEKPDTVVVTAKAIVEAQRGKPVMRGGQPVEARDEKRKATTRRRSLGSGR